MVHAPFPPLPSRKAALLVGAGILGAAVAGMLTRDDPGRRPAPDTEGAPPSPRRAVAVREAWPSCPTATTAENHTVEAVLSAGTAVAALLFFVEELEITPEAIDPSTTGSRPASARCSTPTIAYELAAQIGRVTAARVENGRSSAPSSSIRPEAAAGDRSEGRPRRTARHFDRLPGHYLDDHQHQRQFRPRYLARHSLGAAGS